MHACMQADHGWGLVASKQGGGHYIQPRAINSRPHNPLQLCSPPPMQSQSLAAARSAARTRGDAPGHCVVGLEGLLHPLLQELKRRL